MNTDQLKSLFDNITVWKRRGQRAPHKPLLILYALACCIHHKKRYIPYAEVDDKLKQLLVDFGPTRKSYHPEYPFWRLQNDGIWELKNSEQIERPVGNTDVKRNVLLKYDVAGGFKDDIFNTLAADPEITADIAMQILEANFPHSIHNDILQAVGLDFECDRIKKRKRDPDFRERILNAYQYQCAVCGFNVRVGHTLVGLEAAHIKWHQAGGPDTEENGIALCALHHKLFDRGAFTVSEDMTVQVSDRAHGTIGFQEWLLDYHGKSLKRPQRPVFYPEPEFVNWHVREVFQGESRYPCESVPESGF